MLLQRSKIVVGPKISEVQSGVLHPGGWQSEDLKEEKNVDRGFVLSDHADWDGLVDVIKGTGAEIVKVTHGNGDAISRFLSEKGMNVSELKDSSFQREEME